MVKKQDKRQRSIKAKLMAAICMLLVSSILMVSTTYAWFTLSTAPEVTGITTAVGANGNLEMALQPLDGNSALITSGQGDSMSVQQAYLANTTWGNLVDVSDSSFYGLNNIMLYPAALNTTTVNYGDGTALGLGNQPLSVPEYGADGRVTELSAKTLTGVYNSADRKFVEGGWGVRAVGTSSGMSDRQLAYRAALSAASTASSQAKNVASKSLNTNGAALADIAIKHATTSDGTTETYSVAELQSLQTILNSLLGDGTNTGSLEYIEDALIQYALATALGNTTGVTDDNYASVVADFEAATLDTLAATMTKWNVTANASVTDYIDELQAAYTNVTDAKSGIDGLLDGAAADATFEWDDFSTYLTKLANPSEMQVNGIKVNELRGDWKYKDGDNVPAGYYIADGTNGTSGYVYDDEGVIVSNMARLVDAVLGEGIQLVIASGAGVYADIADFCGDYSASVTLSKISYGGMTVKNLDAKMATKTSQTTPYLELASKAVPPFAAGSSAAASASISDFYGYIIDLAFRTNVADSYLQLQSEAVDRIYADGTNENTMGGGASMTFEATDPSFSGVSVKSLMNCIRIVFFDTDSRAIIGYARLNAEETVEDNGKITMPLVMTDDKGVATGSANIMALEQNTITELSVMVYLDGEKVTNADVANATSSMTGSMNLQFSSSATLEPMDYTNLKTGEGGSLLETTELKNVTGTNVTIGRAVYDGSNVIIQLTGVNADDTVTVQIGDGAAQTVKVSEYSGYTGISVPAAGVTADTVITVTADTGSTT